MRHCPYDPTLSCNCPDNTCADMAAQQAYVGENETERKAQEAAPREHLITSPPDDLHKLTITRAGDAILVHTNNRKMYGEWGTFGFSDLMAQQLIEGLQAILDGASRAVTQAVLQAEQAEVLARQRRAASQPAPAPATLSYDDLFGEP